MANYNAVVFVLISCLTFVTSSTSIPTGDSLSKKLTYHAREDGAHVAWTREAGGIPKIVSVVEVSPREARAMNFPNWDELAPKTALTTRDLASRAAPGSKMTLSKREEVRKDFEGKAKAWCMIVQEVDLQAEIRTIVNTLRRTFEITSTSMYPHILRRIRNL